MILLECLLYAQGTDYQSCKSHFQADSLILLAEIVIGLRTGEQARTPGQRHLNKRHSNFRGREIIQKEERLRCLNLTLQALQCDG